MIRMFLAFLAVAFALQVTPSVLGATGVVASMLVLARVSWPRTAAVRSAPASHSDRPSQPITLPALSAWGWRRRE